MEKVKKLVVSIKFSQNEIEVGELAHGDDGNIYFKYYPEIIHQNIELSPLKLPFNNIINKGETKLFEGLHGLFNDSLPDGWGRLLLDRKLFAKGITPGAIGPLDRLAYVGDQGMGALTYKPKIEESTNGKSPIELDILASEMEQAYEGAPPEVIDQLFDLGGSSGGARPKIFVGYNKDSDHFIHGANELPSDYEHWIIKFQSSSDLPDIANIELAYHKMALDAGIKMSECQLFNGQSGKAYFGTKRFDRIGNNRLHLHSASGLMNDNFAMSTMDYGHLMDAAFTLEKDVEAYEKVLRMAAFNIYTHNKDDHSKNFSFLMDQYGKWELSPAYDLTFSYSSHGMHSTMVAGESASPGEKQLLELAGIFDVKNANEIIEKVKNVASTWKDYAKDASVRAQSIKIIDKEISGLIKN